MGVVPEAIWNYPAAHTLFYTSFLLSIRSQDSKYIILFVEECDNMTSRIFN